MSSCAIDVPIWAFGAACTAATSDGSDPDNDGVPGRGKVERLRAELRRRLE